MTAIFMACTLTLTRVKSLLAALLVLAVVASGCDPGELEPNDEEDEVEQIRAAREALGDPMLRLAGALIRAAELVDALRHEIPRGEGMGRAVEGADSEVERLRDAADEADAAAADNLEVGGAVTRAAEILAVAAEEGRAAADAFAEEAAMLAALAAIDVELDAAVGEWDAPGAVAERRDSLLARVEAVRGLAAAAEAIEPSPLACTRLRDNRVRWAELVAERTQRLADAATPAGGATYDELRDAFRRSPFGEQRGQADAFDADCWQAASPLALAATGIHDRVEDLEDALS
jgi:hypothetical protein